MFKLTLSLTLDGVETSITKIFDINVSQETLQSELIRIQETLAEKAPF